MYDRRSLAGCVANLLESRPSLSLKSISLEIGADRHTIESALVEFSGLPFRALRKMVILRKATDLLISTPACSVKDVAATLGYGSGRAFTRAFKESSGCTPTSFRNPRPR
jgi:AraC-like DNA-binding protein